MKKTKYTYPEYNSSLKNSVKAICPLCRSIHKAYIFWSGRGTPRIFCEICLINKKHRFRFSEDDTYSIGCIDKEQE